MSIDPEKGPTPENMVSFSEQLLNLSIARLTSLLDGYGEVTPALGKDLSEEFRSLRKALEIAYHERANVQKLRGSELAAQASLDLDAARTEIHSRLDRLRRAAGGDGIPG
ncbi:MAG: hypothetical protein ACXIU7_09735 [Roseinatronobacter sp.]